MRVKWILALLVVLAAPAVFAQNYAGDCTSCNTCTNIGLIRDHRCGRTLGTIPDCTSDGCSGCVMLIGRGACDSDSNYYLIKVVETQPEGDVTLVAATLTTSKGSRSVLVKRRS